MGSRTVIYVGGDADLCSVLTERSESGEFQLIERQLAPDLVDGGLLEQWHRVVVLDVDVAEREGFELLRSIKRHHAGVPVIIVGNRQNLPLTQAAVACANGADAVCLKPIEDPQLLFEIIDDGFRRLERWRGALARFADTEDGRPCVVVAGGDSEELGPLSTILTTAGYRVLTATGGRQALELARGREPRLLLACFRLPELEGLALCRAVQADASACAVPVLLIGHAQDDELAAEAREAGAFGVVTMPIAHAELLECVAEACDASGHAVAFASGASR